MSILKKIISKLHKKRLTDDGNRQRLLKSISEVVDSSISPNDLEICIAHNTFEKEPLKNNRVNLHDTYLAYESKTYSLILHHNQMNTLNLVEKDYLEYQNKDSEFSSQILEQRTISKIINSSIDLLKSISPSPSLNEDKALEWLKVTLLTLKKSLQKINHQDTILSYKVFFGAWEEHPILRLMIYNLDIKLVFKSDCLDLIVRNKENRENFDQQAKTYEASFSQLHNEALNEVINLFIKIKETQP